MIINNDYGWINSSGKYTAGQSGQRNAHVTAWVKCFRRGKPPAHAKIHMQNTILPRPQDLRFT